jgi:hypothetical protein
MAAYAVPYTEELAVNIGGPFNTASLWRSMGDPPFGQYPTEEVAEERAYTGSNYAPFVPPRSLTKNVEQPPVGLTAPYKPTITPGFFAAEIGVPTLPDDFIDAPLGPDDMFRADGPEPAAPAHDDRAPNTFADVRNYGGALANCHRGIELAEQGFPKPFGLPDYNLDGDRGYGWPTWDVDPPPALDAAGNLVANDPLKPESWPGGVAHVNAIRITG